MRKISEMPAAQRTLKRIRGGKLSSFLKSWKKLPRSSIQFAGAIALVADLTSMPATAVTFPPRNDFRTCTARLLNVEISPEAAAIACAATLRPRELSSCVTDIARQTEIPASNALSTCRQVRRPSELGRCVVDISLNIREEVNPAVLNYCRRSLLPLRFSQCVVGLRDETDIAPVPAMDICIDGRDRPRDFYPPSR